MGVDKANVRLVVHWTLPTSVSGYAQETGRAGRDGKPAVCKLYFRSADVEAFKVMMNKEQRDLRLRHRAALAEVEQFCRQTSQCRHAALAAHFVGDNSTESCGRMCDLCFPSEART